MDGYEVFDRLPVRAKRVVWYCPYGAQEALARARKLCKMWSRVVGAGEFDSGQAARFWEVVQKMERGLEQC